MFRKNGEVRGTKGKGKRKKRIIMLAAALIIAAGCGITAVRARSVKNVRPSVQTAAADRGDLTSVLDTSGTVVSLHTKTYFSPVNADIREYRAKVGKVVKRGDLLVAFETGTLEEDNRKAELTAGATVNTNRDAVEKANKTVQEAQTASQNVAILQGDIDNFKAYIRDLNTAIADRTRELAGQAAGEVSGAARDQGDKLEALNRALAAAAQKESLEQMNRQYEEEVDSLTVQMSQAEFEKDVDTAQILGEQIRSRQTRIEENEETIVSLRAEMEPYDENSAAEIQNLIAGLSAGGGESPDVADPEADAQISQWQMDLQDAEETLAQLQSDLASEEAKVEAGNEAVMTDAGMKAMENNNNMAELESATVGELLAKGKKGVVAEFSGIVTKADLMQGAAATQGLELVTVASNREVAVEASVSKYDYGKLKVGQKAVVTVGSASYRGTVSDISKVAQVNEKNAPVVTCEVKIENPDDQIFLGVEARVNIIVAEVKNAVKIPVEAVSTGQGGTFCYVVEDGRIVRHDLAVGISSAEETEILSGLRAGDPVILELPDGLAEGMEVEIADGTAAQEG